MAPLDVVIDVSDAQGVIDWAAVANAGIKVAFVKATEDASFAARRWPMNKREAEKAGLKVIPYHFIGRANFERQAAHFRDVAGLTPGSAYALDWEGHPTATAEEVEMMGNALLEITGRTPLGYWGIPGSSPENPTPAMQRWERWVPRYPLRNIANFQQLPERRRSPGVPSYRFWQYTKWGLVPGIHGFVDRSIASFDDVEELVRWCDQGPPTA
jgi:lysozyme